MTMSLFHNLKLKRRKVDSRSSSDGSEVAATDMISPPSLASSSEVSTEDPHSSHGHSAFDVEVKPSKFELTAPRYTSWASPAKLKQEPLYGDETTTLTATVVPKAVFNNGSPNPSPPSSSASTPIEVSRHIGHHRLAEALRPPPATTVTTVAHLPLAAAAAAAKLQAMHPNMVSSSGIPSSLSSLTTAQAHLQPPSSHGLPHSTLRMVAPPPHRHHHHQQPQQLPAKLSPHYNKSEPPSPKMLPSSGPPPPPPVCTSAANTNGGSRKPGPSVILGEHGGVKTMIWTDSTTYWQAANKYRNLASQPSSQAPSPQGPTVQPIVSGTTGTPTTDQLINNVALKVERPDHEHQLKMSSAVDGLLSLSSQGHRPTTTQPSSALPGAPPPLRMPNSPPIHLPHSSSMVSTPSPVHGTDLSTTRPNFPPPQLQPSPIHHHNHHHPHQPPPPQQQSSSQQHPPRRRSPMNMERLWQGDLSQLPSHVIESQNGHLHGTVGLRGGLNPDPEDEEPLLCNICEDRATGLHYGIITCEGCKGFFKRTVQNKRVYSCVADGNCEINKAQRNRCQFCRFKKCLQQGMVLAAVREDRMPGGRNSGAVYNMYKVKYKKHKRANANGKSASTPNTPGPQQTIPSSTSGVDLDPFRRPRSESSGNGSDKFIMSNEPVTTCGLTPITTLPMASSPAPLEMYPHPNKSLLGGVNILRAALTGSNDIPQQYKNLGRQSKDKYEEHHAKLIHELIECDEFDDIATLKNIGELLSQNSSDLEDKLCKIGDSIVHKLVEWVTRLPFYHQLPKEVHTKLLTHKWHELLVLTTSAYQAIHGIRRMGTTRTDGEKVELHQEVATNLVTLQTCLTSMMGKPITMDQLRQDVGNMVEKITKVIAIFRQFQLKMEEYVCLKVIAMVSQDDLSNPTLDVIHEKYLACLRSFAKKHFPNQPNRVEELLVRLPEVQVAASLLLESKMFYVPFLLNSTID